MDAAEVASSRLRSLLDASAAVVEELDLEAVLRRIAEVGMALADARYGAAQSRLPRDAGNVA